MKPLPRYEVRQCIDTLRPALYMRVEATHPGAMEGWVLLAHEPDFRDIEMAIHIHRNATVEDPR
jgi:hypothetical protein